MDTEQLEKQLSVWNRLLYAALGAAITLLLSSVGPLLSIVWFVLQIAVTASGFFLLVGRRWKGLPFSKERTNTIFGFLAASWLLLLVPGVMGFDSFYYVCVSGYAIILLVIYQRVHKRHSDSDEMFP
jgi:hypothetical protein